MKFKKLAISPHYYSPRAYKYVCSIFRFALTHPSVIRSWYKSLNGNPGFTQEILWHS